MKKIALLAAATSVVHAAIALSVDCSNEFRNVTHVGNGALYGVTESVPQDLEALVKPLNPYMFTQPGRAGNGNQHNNGGGAIPVAERLAKAGISSATVAISLPDICPGWPYKYPGWDKWKQEVESVIADKLKSTGKYYGYGIWNEWNLTWQGPNNQQDPGTVSENDRRDSFHQMWKQTFDLIRSKDPTAKIIGPCDAWLDDNRMRKFLTYCKTNNCVPDIACWHELGGTANITNNVKNYRKMETDIGITPPRPITINEYGESQADGDYEGCPGRSAAFIAKLERITDIESASISWWHTGAPGRLGSLLASNTAKGAGWYFYKWYGEMSGKMIMVTPPATNNKNVDGFANIDHDKKFISILFGGVNDASKTVNVTFNKLPTWIGTSAKVKVERVDWTSLTTTSSGPVTISDNERPVANNSLSVQVTGGNDLSGYRIYLTPANASSSSSSRAASSSSVAANVSVTCAINNSNYVGCNDIPRPNVTCGNGTTAGTASFNVTGSNDPITGWNSPNGTHLFCNSGTRNVTLSSVACGSTQVTLDPAISCGSFEIVAPSSSSSEDDPTPILGSGPLTLNSKPATYYSLKGEPLGNAKPEKAGIYIVKQGSSIQKIAVR